MRLKYTGKLLLTVIDPETGQALAVEELDNGVLDMRKKFSRWVYVQTLNALTPHVEVQYIDEHPHEIRIGFTQVTAKEREPIIGTFVPGEGEEDDSCNS